MKEQGIHSRQGGFIKKMMLFVVLICVGFIVLVGLSNFLGLGSGNGIVNLGTGGSSATGASTVGGNNALLGFLNDSGNGIAYGGSTNGQGPSIPASARSRYAGLVSLGSGSASYAVQTSDEYVSLRNNGRSSVDITGWTLTNSKGTRPIQTIENSYVYPVADSATIGQGTQFLDPSGVFRVGDIVLAPGDSAVLTTGKPFISFPFQISTSFRENICDGYLKNYPFTPPLDKTCPYPSNDPYINTVTSECYDYMQSLNRCEDPERDDKTNFDLQTSPCQDFMASRLTYSMCVANHRGDDNFLSSQWRIFLGKSRELWALERETITLYDAQGLIVDRISY